MLSGQWIRFTCTAIEPEEFHSFTLTSAPHEDFLQVHVKAMGPWTWKLRKSFDKTINDKEEDGCGGDARGPLSLDTSLDTSLPKTSIRCDVADEDVAEGRGCDATYCACPLGKTVDERSLKDGAGPEARGLLPVSAVPVLLCVSQCVL